MLGFITEYKNNAYIEKTLVIGAKYGETSAKDSTPGEMTVYMKNGEKYTFPCWTDPFYSSQFGVNVSADGKYVYAISDIKGLWCYTYDGKLVYKTRYTSAEHVFPRADGTAVCVTRSNIILLDESGKVLEKLRVCPDHVPDKIVTKEKAGNKGEAHKAKYQASRSCFRIAIDKACNRNANKQGGKNTTKPKCTSSLVDISHNITSYAHSNYSTYIY